ncbi:NrsF family protein [Aurantimonas sp. A2-1-M11]|uniref:NrsF family protein n=1 Tax=Aurantimonas sp. A2-1-M11 TaxID=3113712 RepID=UPI002F92A795
MQTDTLIDTLVADSRRTAPETGPSWPLLATIAASLAGLVFFTAIGVRPDLAGALQTIRFDFKFVVTGLLAVTAFLAMRTLSRPAASARRLWWLALPAGVMFLAVLAELVALPPDLWMAYLVGSNALMCLTAIPSMGAPALLVFLWALHRQAPTRPAIAGAVAGLAAAAIAAFFYAAHCTDDSPLFVAVWYPLASLVLVGTGALLGRRLLRW